MPTKHPSSSPCRPHVSPARLFGFLDTQIGAQKSGTSALYNYLNSLANVQGAATFEPHFFDLKVTSPLKSFSQERLCELRTQYLHRNFDLESYYRESTRVHPNTLFTFEKTPAYMRHPGTALRVHLTIPNVKLLVVLRNPVTRSYSQYAMEFERARGDKIADSYEDLVQREVESLRAANLSIAPTFSEFVAALKLGRVDTLNFSLPRISFDEQMKLVATSHTWNYRKKRLRMSQNSLYGGMYALQLSEWLRYFELGKTLMVVRFERLLANKSGVFGEVCDFLGIPHAGFNHSILDRDYRSVNRKNRPHKGATLVDSLSVGMRRYLDLFYRPYNQELRRLLGDDWINVWP